MALPTLCDCSLLALSPAPRATLLLEEDSTGLATLSPELREAEDLSLTCLSPETEELLAGEDELLALVEDELLTPEVFELLEEVEPERLF